MRCFFPGARCGDEFGLLEGGEIKGWKGHAGVTIAVGGLVAVRGWIADGWLIAGGLFAVVGLFAHVFVLDVRDAEGGGDEAWRMILRI